jgi:hypothetical protein
MELYAKLIVVRNGPINRYGVVAYDLHNQQNYAIFYKNVEQRKPGAKKL